MIEFRTLGTVEVRDFSNEGPPRLLVRQPKCLALLAYLALAPNAGPRRREEILALLWSEASERRGRASLSQMLYFLRKALGEEAIEGTEEEVVLSQAVVCCDAAAFHEAIRGGDPEEAARLYTGEFLPAFHLPGHIEFERWLDRERARLRDMAVEAAWTAVEESDKVGNLAAAVHWARRATTWAPFDETAHRKMLALLDRVGDRAGAIRAHERFSHRLADELGLEPAPETWKLVEEIRAGEGARVKLPTIAADEPGDTPPAAAARPRPGTPGGPSEEASFRPRSPPSRRRRSVIAGATLLVVVAAGTLISLRAASRTDGSRGNRAVLVDAFQNQAGDPALDVVARMASDWIARGLMETGLVQVVAVLPAFSSDSTPLKRNDDLRAAGEDAGATAVVIGALYAVSDSLFLQASVVEPHRGTLLASTGPVPVDPGRPLEAVVRLQRRVMGTLASLVDERLNRWSENASKPPSFEAYREFIRGLELHVGGVSRLDGESAFEHYSKAASYDSTFTLPLLWAIWVAPDIATADSLLGYLRARAGALPLLDRRLLEYHEARWSGNPGRLYRTARRLVEITPESGFLVKAANAALALDRPREALKLLRRADPDRGWLRNYTGYWGSLISALHQLGLHEEELKAARQARQRQPENRLWILSEMEALAARGRSPELRRLAETDLLVTGSGMSVGGALVRTSFELEAHGFSEEAEGFLGRFLRWFDSRSPGWKAHLNDAYLIAFALWRAGRASEAAGVTADLREVLKSLGLPNHPTLYAQEGALAALGGDTATARRKEAFLAAYTPPVTGRINQFRTRGNALLGQARILANLGETARATALIGEAIRAGGADPVGFYHADPALAPLRSYPPFRMLIEPKG